MDSKQRFLLWVKATNKSKWIDQSIIDELKLKDVEIVRISGAFAMLNTTEDGKEYLQQLEWIKIPQPLGVGDYSFSMCN